MKWAILLLVILCLACVPLESVETIEPIEKDTEPRSDITDPTKPVSDEPVVSQDSIIEMPTTEPDVTMGDYESQCTIEIPTGAEFVQSQYGKSYIDKYVFEDGKRVGPEWMYYDDARTQEKSFSCFNLLGYREGPSIEWDKFGNLEEEIYYKNDMYHGSYKIWEDGILTEEKFYIEGELDGTYKEWQFDGTPKFERNFKLGERHGVWKSYYRGGQLREEIFYEDGIDTGEWYTYYEDGAPQTERTGSYKDGKFTGTSTTWEILNRDGSQNGQECKIVKGVSESCATVSR